MSAEVVVDSSALVALLCGTPEPRAWAEREFAGARLAAPALALFEAANVLRRLALVGELPPEQAALSHADLLDLRIETWPYPPLAERAWQLRDNLTVYDATYVALAEVLGVPLVTLDQRLARAPGISCGVRAFG